MKLKIKSFFMSVVVSYFVGLLVIQVVVVRVNGIGMSSFV